jgi:hypothetical protein
MLLSDLYEKNGIEGGRNSSVELEATVGNDFLLIRIAPTLSRYIPNLV